MVKWIAFRGDWIAWNSISLVIAVVDSMGDGCESQRMRICFSTFIVESLKSCEREKR
jgi:hypothetical protein